MITNIFHVTPKGSEVFISFKVRLLHEELGIWFAVVIPVKVLRIYLDIYVYILYPKIGMLGTLNPKS